MQYASRGWRLAVGQLATTIAQIIHAAIAAYVRHGKRTNAIAELRTMDDHMLADMGISRCGIESAIRSADSDLPPRRRE